MRKFTFLLLAAVGMSFSSHAQASGPAALVFVTSEAVMGPGPDGQDKVVSSYTLDKASGPDSRSLYCRAKLSRSLLEAAKALTAGTETSPYLSTFLVNVYLDGALALAYPYPVGAVSNQDREDTEAALQLTSNGGGGMLFDALMQKSADKLPAGSTHQCRIEMLPTVGDLTGPVLAAGELELKVKPAYVRPVSSTCLPKAALQNAALEASILQAFKAKGWPEVPKAVRIMRDWQTVRNELTGIITKRTLVAVVGSTNQGKCQYQSFLFAQDYTGSGYQRNVYLLGVGEDTLIRCECLP